MKAVDVSIVSGGHDVADARLHRIANALVRRGLSVDVWALGDPRGAPAGVRAHTHERSGHLRRLADAVALPWRARGRVLLVIAPEMVPVAALAARLRRRRLVVDVYEDYLAVVHDRPLSPVAGRLASFVVRRANAAAARAAITSVADEQVPPHQARRRMVVRNLPELERLPPPVEPAGPPRAIYIGDVRRTRGLQMMLAAIEAAPEWQLDIVGQVSPLDEPELRQWQRTSAAAGRVRVHGRMPPPQSWQLASGAWAGLSLLADTPAFRASVPSKIYEYFAVGLPVLATPLPRVREIVEGFGAGRIVASADEAAAVLRSWSADPAALEACRRNALRWAREELPATSPYDELAAQVAKLVEK